MTNNKKVNDSALRALEVFKLMISKDYSKEELLEIISENINVESVHRTETLNKYFNTYKFWGAELSKIGDKYRLNKIPFSVDISDDELEMLVFIFEYAKHICVEKDFVQLQELAQNITKYFDESVKNKIEDYRDTVLLKYKKYLNLKVSKEEVDKYEKYCKHGQKLKVTYNNSALGTIQSFIVEPKETIITSVGCILRAYNPSLAEIQDFYTDNILECEQLPTRSSTTEPLQSVTFRLTCRLASSYELKEGEHISGYENRNSEDFAIVVTNTLEDKTALMKRLLRYGTSCKVLHPSSFQQVMKEQLYKIRSIYK